MANTETLLALQAEYPTAFADPEATPPMTTLPEPTEPDEECRTGETEQTGDELSPYERCNISLLQLEYDPEFLVIAASILEGLATAANVRKHIANEPVRQLLQKAADDGLLINLPETNARQGTEGCASGMCDL